MSVLRSASRCVCSCVSAVFFATTKKIVRIFLLPTATITRAPLDTNQRERGIGKETHTRQIMINTDVCTIHMFALCEINCDMSSKRNHIGQLKIFVGLVRKTHTHTQTRQALCVYWRLGC